MGGEAKLVDQLGSDFVGMTGDTGRVVSWSEAQVVIGTSSSYKSVFHSRTLTPCPTTSGSNQTDVRRIALRGHANLCIQG